jgi:hypothetical protein
MMSSLNQELARVLTDERVALAEQRRQGRPERVGSRLVDRLRARRRRAPAPAPEPATAAAEGR